MLLTIYNLPANINYSDVKRLILEKCGLSNIILDNLLASGNSKKVTIGLAEDSDAAIVVRKINGLYFEGQQLYVEDGRNKQNVEQPYRPSRQFHVPPEMQPDKSNKAVLRHQPMEAPIASQVQAMQNMQIPFYLQNQMQNASYMGYGTSPMLQQAQAVSWPIVPSLNIGMQTFGYPQSVEQSTIPGPTDQYLGFDTWNDQSKNQQRNQEPSQEYKKHNSWQDKGSRDYNYRDERSEARDRSPQKEFRRRRSPSGHNDYTASGRDKPWGAAAQSGPEDSRKRRWDDGPNTRDRSPHNDYPRQRMPSGRNDYTGNARHNNWGVAPQSRSEDSWKRRRDADPQSSSWGDKKTNRNDPEFKGIATNNTWSDNNTSKWTGNNPSSSRGGNSSASNFIGNNPSSSRGGNSSASNFSGNNSTSNWSDNKPPKWSNNNTPYKWSNNDPSSKWSNNESSSKWSNNDSSSKRSNNDSSNWSNNDSPSKWSNNKPSNGSNNQNDIERPSFCHVTLPPWHNNYLELLEKKQPDMDKNKQMLLRMFGASKIAKSIVETVGLTTNKHDKIMQILQKYVEMRLNQIVPQHIRATPTTLFIAYRKIFKTSNDVLFFKQATQGQNSADIVKQEATIDAKPSFIAPPAPQVEFPKKKVRGKKKKKGAAKDPAQSHGPQNHGPQNHEPQNHGPHLNADGRIPKYRGGNKQLYRDDKMLTRKMLSGEVNCNMGSPALQKAMREEISKMIMILRQELDANRSRYGQLVGTFKGLAKEFIETASIHLSSRVLNRGVRALRVYGRPRLPRKPELELYLKQFDTTSLKKSVKSMFYTCTVNSYASFDKLSAKPVKIGESTVTFIPLHQIGWTKTKTKMLKPPKFNIDESLLQAEYNEEMLLQEIKTLTDNINNDEDSCDEYKDLDLKPCKDEALTSVIDNVLADVATVNDNQNEEENESVTQEDAQNPIKIEKCEDFTMDLDIENDGFKVIDEVHEDSATEDNPESNADKLTTYQISTEANDDNDVVTSNDHSEYDKAISDEAAAHLVNLDDVDEDELEDY